MRHQRTIKRAVVLKGRGIHTGENVKLKIEKAPAGTGVVFIRTDLKNRPVIAANVSNLANNSGDRRCTLLKNERASVQTIEHLMAALGSLSIDNAMIEIDNKELPALDGSALDYAAELQRAGSVDQDEKKRELILKEPIWCDEQYALLLALPSVSLNVSCLVQYGGREPMVQSADFSFSGADTRKKEDLFIKEIAPARTFCMEKEVADIKNKGLGKGGNYKNTIVIRNGRPVENEFRLENEPARHKIVDLLGDLYLINADIKAQVIGVRSGHSLNAKLIRKLEGLL